MSIILNWESCKAALIEFNINEHSTLNTTTLSAVYLKKKKIYLYIYTHYIYKACTDYIHRRLLNDWSITEYVGRNGSVSGGSCTKSNKLNQVMPLEKSLERGDSSNYLTCCCWPLCCCSSESAPLWSRNNLAKKNKICYLERLQSGLFLLQSLLLLLLIHAAEGHAGGGERRDGVRQGGCSARGENRGGVQFFFLREYSRGGTVKFHMLEMQMSQMFKKGFKLEKGWCGWPIITCLPGVCIQLLGLLALQRGKVLLQSLQQAAGSLRVEYEGRNGGNSVIRSTCFYHMQKN